MESRKKGGGFINEEEYFEYLLTTYKSLVYAICFKAVKNQFDAEDLTQEAFLSIYKSLSTFSRQYEKAWVCKIASNKCLDFFKHTGRRSFPVEQEYFTSIVDQKAAPEDVYLENESKQVVYHICQKLKQPYREIAIAHFYKEQTAKEIAERASKNLKTVQTQIYRAKDMLKKIMEKEGV